MLVETEAAKLREALKTLTTVLAQKVDGECLVTAKKDKGLIIEGFRDGTHLKCTLPAEVYQEGEVVVKAAYLTALKIRDKVTLQLNNTWLEFTSGKLRGHVETSQDIERFKASRPVTVINTPFDLACEDLIAAMKRAFLQPTLVGQQYGIRCQLLGDPEDETLPATLVMSSIESRVRAVLVKKPLPITFPRGENGSHVFMDVMLPPVVWSIVSKIKGPIQIGTDGKAFRLVSARFDLYQPLLNIAMEDIEEWLSVLPQDQITGIFNADVPTMLEGITQAASVVVTVGTMAQEVSLECTAQGDNLKVEVSATSGEATSDIPLENGPEGKLRFRLGSRHITESLGLLATGNAEVKVWTQPSAVLVYSGPHQNSSDSEEETKRKAYEMKTYYVIPQTAGAS
jgi:hypothetical protein